MNRFLPPAVAVLGLVVSLTGCGGFKSAQYPDVVIADAHTGGSIVAFDAGSTRLASGGWDGEIALWKLPEGQSLHQWRAHAGTVNGIVFLKGDRRLLSGGYDGDLAEWDAQGRLLRRVAAGSPITAMAAAEEDDVLVTGHADGTVRLWALGSLQLRGNYAVHSGAVRAVAYQAGERRMASSGTDTRVYLWRTPDAQPLALPGPPTDSRALEFSPDGQWLVGSGWFRLFRWNLRTTELTTVPTEHRGIVTSLQYSPDGRYLASISRKTDSSVYFLDPMDGQVLRRFHRHDLCGGWIALSPDHKYLATTSDDASVRIWWLDKSSQ
jgi:WD40 repeat protein